MAPRTRHPTPVSRSLEMAEFLCAWTAQPKVLFLGCRRRVFTCRHAASIGPALPRTQPTPEARGAGSPERPRLGSVRPLAAPGEGLARAGVPAPAIPGAGGSSRSPAAPGSPRRSSARRRSSGSVPSATQFTDPPQDPGSGRPEAAVTKYPLMAGRRCSWAAAYGAAADRSARLNFAPPPMPSDRPLGGACAQAASGSLRQPR